MRQLLKSAFFCTLTWVLIFPQLSHGFPEMIRAGYTNCTTCHVSPSGGGLLTDYGRNLSAEVLSTSGSDREAQIGHGLFGISKDDKEDVDHWLGIGGDVRAVQTHTENEFVKTGRFIWMQAMLDLAYRWGGWSGVISIGKFDSQGKGTWRPYSENYYLMRQINDRHLVRVGRFIPAFGLNIPDHISPTRGGYQGEGLGFGIAQERDAAEWQLIDENWNAALGYSEGPRDGFSPFEQAFNGQLQRAFSEHYKIGLSAWSGRRSADRRQIFAIHGMLGFTEHFYLLTELDAQFLQPNSGPESIGDHVGYFGYHKLGYEFYKGMHVFALLDHSQPDSRNDSTLIRHWGAGMQFFPRPHFELTGAWTRELVKSVSNNEGDYAWLLFHYYL